MKLFKLLISISAILLIVNGCGDGGGSSNNGNSGNNLGGGSGSGSQGGSSAALNKHWQGAKKLVAPNYTSRDSKQIKVAINENTNAIATFKIPLPSQKVNLSSSFYDGNSWQNMKNIGDYGYFLGVSYKYNIALDPNNIAYLLATNYDSNVGTTKLYKFTFNNNQWSTANLIANPSLIRGINFKINSDNKNVANLLDVIGNTYYIVNYKLTQNQFNTIYHINNSVNSISSSISREGNKKIVAFIEYDSNMNKRYLKASIFDGNSWSNPVEVAQIDNNVNTKRIAVAIDKNGNALIAWADKNSQGDIIVKAKYKKINVLNWPQNPTIVAFENSFDFNSPTLAISDNKAIVVMEKIGANPPINEVWARVFDKSTKQWGNLEKISTAPNAGYPVIASAKNDIFMAAWIENSSSDGDNYADLATKIYNNGWSDVKYIEDVNSKDVRYILPDIDMNNNADAVVGWIQRDSIGKLRAYVNVFK